MIIKCLVENNSADDSKYIAEHGVSFLIKTEYHKILFDMGQSDAFYKNALRMGERLDDVDIAVLSHGHYDHGGGLETFLKINKKAFVYVDKRAFGQYYNGTEKYIGLDSELKDNLRIEYTLDEKIIDEDIRLITCNDEHAIVPVDSFGLNVKRGDRFYPDEFLHEQYLEIIENDKKILFSGCSHKGIVNIINWTNPDILIGGFHLKKIDCATMDGCIFLDELVEKLMGFKTRYYTCHCTGNEQYAYLKQRMGNRLSYVKAGETLEI